MMELPESIFASMVALGILLLLHIDILRPAQRTLADRRLLLWLIRAAIATTVVDILCVLSNGNPGPLNRAINYYGNMTLFKIDAVVSLLWLFYIMLRTGFNRRQLKRMTWALAALYSIALIVGTVGLQYGWVFFIDANNIFHRGPYYFAHVALCYFPMVLSVALTLFKPKSSEALSFSSMLFIVFPVTVGGAVQLFYNGAALTWAGLAFSLLTLYFYIQNKGLMTDYLTGSYNRRQLDQFLRQKINGDDTRNFAAIMIDLDGFKHINDSLGHLAGDRALRTVSQLLAECLRKRDFIARIGGDEFFIVLDIDDPERLEEVVGRIRARVRQFNQSAAEPYTIRFSMGYDIYRRSENPGMLEFMKHIDALMYKQKKPVVQVEWPLPSVSPDAEPLTRGPAERRQG